MPFPSQTPPAVKMLLMRMELSSAGWSRGWVHVPNVPNYTVDQSVVDPPLAPTCHLPSHNINPHKPPLSRQIWENISVSYPVKLSCYSWRSFKCWRDVPIARIIIIVKRNCGCQAMIRWDWSLPVQKRYWMCLYRLTRVWFICIHIYSPFISIISWERKTLIIVFSMSGIFIQLLNPSEMKRFAGVLTLF